HYDIWHRKMKNFTNLKRFMVKFEFTRMNRPRRPAWNNRSTAWRMPKEPPPHPIEPMWQDQWRWHRGEPAAPPAKDNGAAAPAADAAALATLAARLDDDSEPAGLQALAGGVADPDVYVRINAVEALGLKATSPVAVDALSAALADPEDEVRFNAALSLARLGPGAAAAVPALAPVLEDGNRYVVGYAIEALERIATPDAITVLLPFLKTARWCPITNSGSLF